MARLDSIAAFGREPPGTPTVCTLSQLKALYVRSSHRSHGAGGALMAWVAGYAVEHGCCRIDWPVKASNARGISFYEGLGAQRVLERLSYRLSEPELSRLAPVNDRIIRFLEKPA